MSPKQAILRRCVEKISGNHDSMDSGVEHSSKYWKLVGANEAYSDIHDFVRDLRDEEDEDLGELEDLPE